MSKAKYGYSYSYKIMGVIFAGLTRGLDNGFDFATIKSVNPTAFRAARL